MSKKTKISNNLSRWRKHYIVSIIVKTVRFQLSQLLHVHWFDRRGQSCRKLKRMSNTRLNYWTYYFVNSVRRIRGCDEASNPRRGLRRTSSLWLKSRRSSPLLITGNLIWRFKCVSRGIRKNRDEIIWKIIISLDIPYLYTISLTIYSSYHVCKKSTICIPCCFVWAY